MNMAYFPPEIIKEAREMDLLSYLQNYEPDNLKRCSRGTYCTKEHDSLKISNGKWMWFSQGIGGISALDYLIKVKEMKFLDAVELITGKTALSTPIYVKQDIPVEQLLLLPEKCESTNRIKFYLMSRGIDEEIIQFCIDKKLIFESLPYHNVVFIGFDNQQKPKYASYRATNGKRILGECSGSKKEYSFRLEGSNPYEIHLFESAIDLLSYATLHKINGGQWKELNLVSLAGVYAPKSHHSESKLPKVLEKFIEHNKNIKRIILHLDNDIAGKTAANALLFGIPSHIEVVNEPPAYGKDVNDFLCLTLNLKRKKERNLER